MAEGLLTGSIVNYVVSTKKINACGCIIEADDMDMAEILGAIISPSLLSVWRRTVCDASSLLTMSPIIIHS